MNGGPRTLAFLSACPASTSSCSVLHVVVIVVFVAVWQARYHPRMEGEAAWRLSISLSLLRSTGRNCDPWAPSIGLSHRFSSARTIKITFQMCQGTTLVWISRSSAIDVKSHGITRVRLQFRCIHPLAVGFFKRGPWKILFWFSNVGEKMILGRWGSPESSAYCIISRVTNSPNAAQWGKLHFFVPNSRTFDRNKIRKGPYVTLSYVLRRWWNYTTLQDRIFNGARKRKLMYLYTWHVPVFPWVRKEQLSLTNTSFQSQ